MMIGVVGLGFVGLTTALGFAHKNHTVYGFDISQSRVEELQKGRVPFHEPQIEKYLKKYQKKNFFLCESLSDLVSRCRIIFYCVGTPSSDEGSADLEFLKAAVQDSLKNIKESSGKVLVIKSTVPPSSASRIIASWISEMGLTQGIDVGLVSNPEFLREGHAWEDFVHPDRIVLGANDVKSGKIVSALYKSFGAPIHLVSLTSAEFIKYLSNCLLTNMISFSNEMAMLAEILGEVDVPRSFRILHEDRRWSGKPAAIASYVYPGCGFGGYCLPKDTQALQYLGIKNNCPMPIVSGVIKTNKRIKDHVADKIARAAKIDDPVGILGLAFKPGSDDVRDTPALAIIRRLLAKGFSNLAAYDPLALENFKLSYGLPIRHVKRLEDIVKSSKVLVLLTSWPEFKKKSLLFKGKVVIDGRYFLDKKSIAPSG